MKVIWGGTFDPVHNGHIQLAKRLVAMLNLAELYLMPCFKAVHKENVSATASQRLTMLSLATQHIKELQIDHREIEKQTKSYTYDSLMDIRREIGLESLNFVMGLDSLLTFPDWYRSKEIHKIANLIIINRPLKDEEIAQNDLRGQALVDQKVKQLIELGFISAQTVTELAASYAGKFLILDLSEMHISSTDIRKRVKKGEKISHLVDSGVNEFITTQHLYLK